MWLGSTTDKPSAQLAAFLRGELVDAPDAIKSWARFECHKAAMQIAPIKSVAKRRAMLAKIPEGPRKLVQNELLSIWARR